MTYSYLHHSVSLHLYHLLLFFFFFFFNDTATTEIYTLSLHDALPISVRGEESSRGRGSGQSRGAARLRDWRSEEHTSELQSRLHLVCRLLLEKKKGSRPARRSAGSRSRPPNPPGGRRAPDGRRR